MNTGEACACKCTGDINISQLVVCETCLPFYEGVTDLLKTVPKGAACPRAKPVRHKVGEERAIILAILNCGPVSCQTWSGVQGDDDRFHGNWSSHVGLARCPGGVFQRTLWALPCWSKSELERMSVREPTNVQCVDCLCITITRIPNCSTTGEAWSLRAAS